MDESDSKNAAEAGNHLLDATIESTPAFLTMYDHVDDLFLDQFDDVYLEFYNQLDSRTKECDVLLGEVSVGLFREATEA